MFSEVFIEEQLLEHPRVKNLKKKLPSHVEYFPIDRVENYWGRSKKPYLQKRQEMKLYVGEKRGQLVKKAPPAYGQSGAPHYYFIHAYNCIYECQYCYLQGHFNTPDLVMFINHQDIVQKMQEITDHHTEQQVWFHAGEFSDSLALSHLSGELEAYWPFFKNNPKAHLELRTKSANTTALEKLPPLNNVIVSFSLMPSEAAKIYDLKTPPIKSRLKAIQRIAEKGHSIAIHFDPIILSGDFLQHYQQLLTQLNSVLPWEQLLYLSLGVVRFTKGVYGEVLRNYPSSPLHNTSMVKSFDGKVRYNRPTRQWMLKTVQELAINHGLTADKIYLCMED